MEVDFDFSASWLVVPLKLNNDGGSTGPGKTYEKRGLYRGMTFSHAVSAAVLTPALAAE